MSQQALDLRRSIQIVRRHSRLFGAVVALGLIIGAAYAVIEPPMFTSTALVVLPEIATQSGQAQASSTGASADTNIDTQAVIADSDSVLAGALSHVSPVMSLQTLQSKVQITTLTGNIISISASGKTAGQAETTANAIANSYIAYVSTATNPVGRVLARPLESATTASGSSLSERVTLFGLLGALAGALVGFVVSVVIGQNDRRLRERDSIANSIGVPVIASFPVEHPSDPAGWSKLLEAYEPGVVHALRLRATLQQLGLPGTASGNGVGGGAGNGGNGADNGAGGGAPSVTILSLASDAGALAIGPQLASYAASQGIPTVLIIGPQRESKTPATLRTAGASVPQSTERMRYLRVIVSDDDKVNVPRSAGLVVVVASVDPQAPQMPTTVRTTATMLAVSAGAATAEQLALAATAAAADGCEIFGILVANPDPSDQTTGRIPRLAPPVRRQMPMRVKDVPMETKR